MTLIHGGNVYELASHTGCSPDDILDYSASINPLGPPPGLSELITRYFHRLQHYPDINNTVLIDALAEYHGISPECIAVGNGSTELIYWLPRALGLQNALAVLPTFSEYAKAFELQGVSLQKLISTSGNGFQPRLDQLEAALAQGMPEAVLLTHPGSPGGGLLDDDVRSWILDRSRAGQLFVIDEVFIDFCEEESFKKYVDDSANLVLIRSLTKFYGLPGLRMGYIIAPPRVVQAVRHLVPPWSVNTLAQISGAYCVKQDEYRLETLALVTSERNRVAGELAGMKGLRVFPGVANYLLIELDERLPAAHVLRQDVFDAERIVIRTCSSFDGLDERHFRIAIRLPEQNDRLLNALRKWTEEKL